jgi:hypothetical protein
MEDESKEMYIPTIGDEITLSKAWRFGLYYEYRNEAMIKFIFPGTEFQWRNMVLPNGDKPEYGKRICDVELPKGAILKVDRIYIRKGNSVMKEFDSVTFVLQSIPKKEIAIPEKRDVFVRNKGDSTGKYGRDHGEYVKKQIIKKKVRFWAKLRDVNQVRFYMGREKVDSEESSVRLIRVGEDWCEEKK